MNMYVYSRPLFAIGWCFAVYGRVSAVICCAVPSPAQPSAHGHASCCAPGAATVRRLLPVVPSPYRAVRLRATPAAAGTAVLHTPCFGNGKHGFHTAHKFLSISRQETMPGQQGRPPLSRATQAEEHVHVRTDCVPAGCA